MSAASSIQRLRPVIRLFVSSTFSDMKHERNALQESVFPKLEQLCAENGFQFQAIDLRWGVPAEAGLDHRTMQICFEELRRAQEISPQPNFLILHGDRYGWRPLPEEISVQEFAALESAAAAIERTTNKPGVQTLRNWYRRDDNAIPPVHILQSRRQDLRDGVDYTRKKSWAEVQEVLWQIVNEYLPPESLTSRFGEATLNGGPPPAVRFQGSATEQEIWHGAFGVHDADKHVLAFMRGIENIEQIAKPRRIVDFVDIDPAVPEKIDERLREEQRRLKLELKGRLGRRNVSECESARLVPTADGKRKLDETTDHLSQLCSFVEGRLTEIVDRQIKQYWNQTAKESAGRLNRELKIEQDEHRRFGSERGDKRSFVGRKKELKEIQTYIQNDSHMPLVVHGASGCGKTALLARASQMLPKSFQPLVRFIGVTPSSSDLRALLGSLCRELRIRNPRDGDVPMDANVLVEEFRDHLQTATAERPIILFLDALDQLSETDSARKLHWIPTGPLPNHVKIVVSCLSERSLGDSARIPFEELERRKLPASQRIDLDALSEGQATALLFKKWLPQAGRKVNDRQRARMVSQLKSKACRHPIYLRLLFEEAKLWRSYEDPPKLGHTVPALLRHLVTRLGRKANHGRLLVNRSLSYLATSRWGLAETEILELLFADDEYKKELKEVSSRNRHEMPLNATRIPIAAWSRLRFDLSPYLTERAAPGANVLAFYHRQVSEYVQEHLAEAAAKEWNPHTRLVTYFHKSADPTGNKKWSGDRPRPFLELVFHLCGANRTNEICDTLCDLLFVEARCRFGQIFELFDDHRLAKGTLPEAHDELCEERERQACLDRYSKELTAYSAAWSDRRDRLDKDDEISEPEPVLPEAPPTCRMWTEMEIEEECDRIRTNPKPLDRLRAFEGFVTSQCFPLLEFGRESGFVRQHALNTEPTGPLHQAAAPLLVGLRKTVLLRRWPPEARHNPQPALIRTLEGHTSAIYSMSVTPDGRRAVSASMDHTMCVWDLRSGLCIRTVQGCGDDPICVGVTADGSVAITAISGGALSVWDLESGICLRTLNDRGHDACVSVTPDGRRTISGTMAGALQVWDPEVGLCNRNTEGDTGEITSLSLAPDGRRAVSGGYDETVRLWDLERSMCTILEGHCESVVSVCMTPDSRRAVSGDLSGAIRLWDLESAQCIRALNGHSDAVRSVSMTADGQRAISTSEDKTLKVWDLESGRCLRSLALESWGVSSACVALDGRRAVSGSTHSLRIWNLESGNCIQSVERHSRRVTSLSVTPDGQWALSGSEDNDIRLWNLETGAYLKTLEGHCDIVLSVKATPAGRRAVSGSRDTTLRIWDLESGECLCTLEGHSDLVDTVDVTPDGRRAVSGSRDTTLRVWDLDSGQCLRTLTAHHRSVWHLAVTKDGRRVVSASEDTTLRVWDLESGLCLRTLEEHGGTVYSITMNPDGRRAVSASADNTLRVWDLETGRCLLILECPCDLAVCITPDGQRLVLACSDYSIRVWHLESGLCLHKLTGHTRSVWSVEVTHDGRSVVSGGSDGTLRLWDLESGECISVNSTTSPVSSVALQARENIICVGTSTGEVLFLHPQGLDSGPPILTASSSEKACCPVCGQEFEPSPAVLSAIRDSNAAGLSSRCSNCLEPLQFNPFFSAAEDYPVVLRRGLEISRREKGDNHAETLAHLGALAVHLSGEGNQDEAAEYQREYDLRNGGSGA